MVACSDDVEQPVASAPVAPSSVVINTTSTTTSTTPVVSTSVSTSVPVSTVTTATPSTAPATSTPPPPVVGDPVVASEVVATLESPVALGVRPGDEALYVVEQTGRVVRVVLVPGADAETTVVADVSDRIATGGERGLLGIAFSGEGTRAWLNYTEASNGNTVVAEYPVSDGGTFDIASERVLLEIAQPYSNHNGGDLLLGPDSMLYIATGDGGSANDPERRANDPTSLLGKLLRIDPTPSADSAYTIPPDNPFAAGPLNGVEGAPEVFAWGLRNPWRNVFDPVTGALWIADVGQNQFEEVNIVAPTDRPAGWGADFGWSAFEGTERFNTDVPDPGNTVFPVLTYQHGSNACSVSGGAVYRGTAIPALSPAYVYGDYCSGSLWALDLAGARNLTLGTFGNISAVRVGPDAELYVLELDGDVNRLVAG